MLAENIDIYALGHESAISIESRRMEQAGSAEVIYLSNRLKKNPPKRPNNQSEERWVDPIRDKADIHKCLEYLKSRYYYSSRKDMRDAALRNYLLFVVGINVGLRVSDLTALRWSNLYEPDMETFIDAKNKREKKTKKMKVICPNTPIKEAVQFYRSCIDTQPEYDDFVFMPTQKSEDHLKTGAVEYMMKNVAKACSLKGNYNTHSLRKTYAYQLYMSYTNAGDQFSLVKVQRALNHRNAQETICYLGFTRDQLIKDSQSLGDWLELDIPETSEYY